MKTQYKFDIADPLPVIIARVKGKLRNRPIRLIFDTGAFMTQISTRVVEELGYTALDATEPISATGPSGPIEEGYALKVEALELLSKKNG